MLSAARDYVRERFDVKRTAKEYLREYRAELADRSTNDCDRAAVKEVDETFVYRKIGGA